MSRIHIALNSHRFEESIDFYRTLFRQEPAKLRDNWAKFDLQEPALNLTLNRAAEEAVGGDINHLGIEVADAGQVAEMDRHLRDSGLQTLVEDNVTCCFAVQDKTWVADPNGHSWEFFYVKSDADDAEDEVNIPRQSEPAAG